MAVPAMFTLALLTAASVAVSHAAELTIKPLGQLFYKPLGGAMVFTCEINVENDHSAGNNYQMQWFDSKGEEITDRTGSRRYVEEEEMVKKLYITDIERDDEGDYRCTATVGDEKPEKTVTLKLFKEITFDSATTPQHPRLYSDALIKCVVSGQPKPEISWRYKGMRIVIGDRYSKEADGLRVTNITLADDGEYTCRAEVESDGRYDERKITVNVHIPPTMTEGPGKAEGVEGDVATISCRASGMPAPTFEFYKDGTPVVNTSRIQVDPVLGTIHFGPLDKDDESTRYNCTARNDVGLDSAIGELKVLVRPSVYELKSVIQEESKPATMVCLSRGDPAPSMTFHKIGAHAVDYQIGPNDDGRVVVTAPADGKLQMTISSLQPSDSAEYTCRAQNKVGESNDTATITVQYKPRFAANHSKVEYVWAGASRNVTCRALAEPEPVMHWERFNRKLADNDTYRIFSSGRTSNMQVTVRESDQAWIYGMYKCVARNQFGDGQILIELKRASVPDAPTAVNATERKPNSVLIKVEPPDDNGGMPIIGYRVEYNNNSYEYSVVTAGSTGPPYNTQSTSTESQGNEIRIDNLQASTVYLFAIRARNEVGVGSPVEHSVTTAAVRRPYPVIILSASDETSNGNYRVRWRKPDTGGKPITQYEFLFKRVDDEEGIRELDEEWTKRTRQDQSDSPMLHFDLDDLEPNTHYKLLIRAENTFGWSDNSDHYVFRTGPVVQPVSTAMSDYFCHGGFMTALTATIASLVARYQLLV